MISRSLPVADNWIDEDDLCMFILNWPSPTLCGFFTNPVTDMTGIRDRLIISMLSFKRRMLIIPGIHISAGREGII